MYRDEKGFKYARLIGLNKTLDIQQPKDLFTFTALTQWLQTKPKRKEILFKTGKNFATVASERFLRARNIVRLNSALIGAAILSQPSFTVN